jgi:putative restriction endonuclease
MATLDATIREGAFDFLRQEVLLHGDVLPWSLLHDGFMAQGERIRFVGPQGIFKPKCMELPLSITTAPQGPYDDGVDAQGLLLYRYRGSDPSHRDNVGLRRAMETATPLVYLKGIVKGKYLATWPVFVVGADPTGLTFRVAVDAAELPSDLFISQVRDAPPSTEMAFRRAYATRLFKQRLHQRSFRERVLRAYREQCAICRLRHQELLDAAHIIADTEEGGSPIVPNGLALCKLHHAAFDRHFVGVRGDYTIEVRPDVLRERDGPMLIHGLQQLHGRRIAVPRAVELRPDPQLLWRRYQVFRAAG